MPSPRLRSAVFTTSVDVMETTAGATRAAMSANEGIVTVVTGPALVVIGPVCAFDLRITPRSALMMMPNATDAITIAISERMRLLREFIEVSGSF